MSTFTVNPESLDALAAHLENLGHRMLSLQQLPSGDIPSLGGSHVQRSLEHFSSTWSYGVGLLNRSVAEMTTHLQQAATTYTRTDSNIGTTFGTDATTLAPLFASDDAVDQKIADTTTFAVPPGPAPVKPIGPTKPAPVKRTGPVTPAEPKWPTQGAHPPMYQIKAPSSGSGTETIG